MQIRTVLAGAAVAAAAFGATAPAMAQSFGYGYGYGYAPAAYGYGGWGGDPAAALHAREDRVGEWIREAAREGRIGGWQAGDVFARLQRVRDDERRARWAQDGRLSGDQLARLNDRVSLIADQVRLDRDRDAAAPAPPRFW